MKLVQVLKKIFAPNDGIRRRVHAEVVESVHEVEAASMRLDNLIRQMMDRNDGLTGRKPQNAPVHRL